MSAACSRPFGVKLALLIVLTAAAGAAAQTLEGGPSSVNLVAGGSLRFRCSATGPSGLALRLACPLLTGLWPPVPCFEDCRRPPSAASIPELTSASCELQRRLLPPSGSQEVTIEYDFSNVSQKHIGNYTCQFMLLRAVSLVTLTPVTMLTALTRTTATTASATTTKARELTTLEALRLLTTSNSGTKHMGAGLATVTMATTSASSIESPDDWFRMKIYGPITLGHVLAVSLSVAIVLLLACLIGGLLSCYCRRRHQKRRDVELTIPVDGTAGWLSAHSLGQQFTIGGFSPADVVASASATATLAGGADASWPSPSIYTDAEYSPLISGSGRRNNGFGSQGVGINTGVVGGNGSSSSSSRGGAGGGAGGGSFFNRDQPGRHSFHSVRQHQLVSRGLATATASPVMATKPLPNQRSPTFSPSSSAAVPDNILQLVAAQQAEINRLGEQLRSSQQQLNRLAASSTDLQRCLSSKQLNASARLRHESGPQQQQQQQQPPQQPDEDRDGLQVRQGGFVVGSGGGVNVYCSSDALTVETIDEEFEADGTLKVPARKRQAPLSQPLESLNRA